MKYLLGVDLGTSGTKTVLFDENGQAISSQLVEYPLHQPQNGWSEQDPADWWNACATTIRAVLEQSGIDAGDIAGIGMSGQMHGLVLLDEDGKTLGNSIIWNDGRTALECEEVTRRVGAARLIDITANPALTGFTAGKILWVRKHRPELYAKARHILLPKDYLRFKLTGVYATEVSDASGMNLLDIRKRAWSDEVLRALDIDPSLMARMHESVDITGTVSAEAARLTGLKEGTPVVGGAGDNAAAAIGTGVVESGKAFTTLGTSGVIFAHADEVSIDPQGRVHTFCSAVPGAWVVMGCALSAGFSLQWFRNQFFAAEMQTANGLGVDPYMLMDNQAERIPIGADRLLFLPYLMGERSPLLDPNARGVFFGLSGMHTKYNMLRAVLEGVVFALRSSLDVLNAMDVHPQTMLATGGGGKSKLWRQMIADIYGCPVTTVANSEGPALGAAILAGVGAGVYSSVPEACRRVIKIKGEQEPIAANVDAYKPFYELFTALYPSLKQHFAQLGTIG